MNDKRLAEYVGVCLHEWKKIPSSAEFDEMSGEDIYDYVCPLCNESYEEPVHKYNLFNYDFTTPDGWHSLVDKMYMKGDWEEFYKFLCRKYEAGKDFERFAVILTFHENPNTSEKVAEFSAWLDEKTVYQGKE